MLIPESAFTVGDVTVFRDGSDPAVLYTAPHVLQVVTSHKGMPSFGLTYFGPHALLMLETEWVVSPAQRSRILAVAQGNGKGGYSSGRVTAVRLVPAPVVEGTERLYLEEAGDSPVLLAETRVSGYGSMRAAISLQLPVATAARVERALRVDDADLVARGEFLSSTASNVEETWTADLGRVRQVLAGAGRGFGADDVFSMLPELFEQRAIVATGNPSAAGSEQRDRLQRTLAELLAARLTGKAVGKVTLSHATNEPQPLRFSPSCSISEALRGRDVSSFVRNLSGTAG
jgi:hypothetical protein